MHDGTLVYGVFFIFYNNSIPTCMILCVPCILEHWLGVSILGYLPSKSRTKQRTDQIGFPLLGIGTRATDSGSTIIRASNNRFQFWSGVLTLTIHFSIFLCLVFIYYFKKINHIIMRFIQGQQTKLHNKCVSWMYILLVHNLVARFLGW